MTLIIIFSIYAASVAFLSLRGVTFPKWSRRLTDFSTFLVPFNIPAYLFSKIPRTALIDKKYYPEIQVIEDNWETIRDEAMQLYQLGYIDTHDDLPGSSFYRDNRWKSFYLKVYKNQIPSAYQYAPKTMALIEQAPSMNLALFAMLMPGKNISIHHDPFSFSVRYSLGLSTPNSNQSGIKVDRHDHKWMDGDSIIFDENYMHSAYNNTDTPRLILMTDLDRPLWFKPAQWIYYWFGFGFNRVFGVDNLDGQYSGIGNKFTGTMKSYRAFMKQKKKNHPFIYNACKYVLFLLIILMNIVLFI